MKPSKFNVMIPMDDPSDPVYSESDKILLYNTFSDSRVVISPEVLDAMAKARDGRYLTDEENEVLTQLLDLGFMVEQNVDEDLELEYWFQKYKFDTTEMGVTLLTTSACNLGCVYCYEKGIAYKHMKEETWRRSILWMIRKLDDVRPRTFRLTFFGGEPLLNPDAIRGVAEEISYACRKRNVELDIRIVTNGVLLTRELVDFLLPFGLRGIKITLDGDKETHDQLRPFKGGQGTFDTILDNMRAIRGLVPITIGGNFYTFTQESVPRLLDHLKDSGFTASDIAAIQFKPILSGIGEVGGKCAVGKFSDIEGQAYLWMREEIQKRGFPTIDDVSLGPCDAAREFYYVLDPSGKIYKCPGFVGREEFAIGDLHNDRFLHRNVQFMTVDLWKKCKGCPFIPVCGGGCRVNAEVACGDFRQESCDQRYFIQVGMEVFKKAEMAAMVTEEL